MATLAVVVPTRNRPDFAIAAIRSLLGQDVELDVYVSDNSADPKPLRAFCARERRATWLRPERELAMPDHWEWALQEVLSRSAATHVSVHYDRKISKPREWGRLARIAALHPDRLVSFAVDHVSHWPPPLRLWQGPWTGKLFAIETAKAAEAIARGRLGAISHALPILSNCVIPRRILEAVAGRFGDICNSTGPDSAFMSRFLAVADSYLHVDRTTGILYGTHRSNGMGYMRGTGGDFADFRATFGDRAWLPAAPLPGLSLGQNMLYHEYELVRRDTGARLPPIDRAAAIEDMAGALVWIDDPDARAQVSALLRSEGWSGAEPAPLPGRDAEQVRAERRAKRRMRWRGEVPPHISGFSFPDDRRAVKAALRYPRGPEGDASHLAGLTPTELA